MLLVIPGQQWRWPDNKLRHSVKFPQPVLEIFFQILSLSVSICYHFKGGLPFSWLYFNQMLVRTRLCCGCIIYSPTVSGAKWSEQQLLVRLKQKPPQGEGYRNDLTLCRQRCRCVMSGFWAEGNSLLVVQLWGAGCVLLEHSSSVLAIYPWAVNAGKYEQGDEGRGVSIAVWQHISVPWELRECWRLKQRAKAN